MCVCNFPIGIYRKRERNHVICDVIIIQKKISSSIYASASLCKMFVQKMCVCEFIAWVKKIFLIYFRERIYHHIIIIKSWVSILVPYVRRGNLFQLSQRHSPLSSSPLAQEIIKSIFPLTQLCRLKTNDYIRMCDKKVVIILWIKRIRQFLRLQVRYCWK